MSNRNSSAVYVQSKISIIADGQRGVTLSQVINAPSPNDVAPAVQNYTDDYGNGGVEHRAKLKHKSVPAITDKTDQQHREERRKHSHRHAVEDHSRKNKTIQRTSTKKPGHGKPSSVKSRNSSKKSKQSLKSSSSKYSEPNPILPDEGVKDLAELLLEKLSSGSTVTSRLYKDEQDDGNSTIRLSSLPDEKQASLDDTSFFENVSYKEDGSKKFTKYTGRPLDKNEKQQAEPSRGVRFETAAYNDKTNRFSQNQQHQQKHVPLSVQLAVSDKYADDIRRDELAHQSLQKPRIPVKPDVDSMKPSVSYRSPSAQQRIMVDKSTQQSIQPELNTNVRPTVEYEASQNYVYQNSAVNHQNQTVTNKITKPPVTSVQPQPVPAVQPRNIRQPGFSYDNTEVITIRMRPQSAMVDEDFRRHYMRSSLQTGNSGFYTGHNGKEYYTIV